MDASRFDRLVQLACTAQSRRQAIKRIAGAAIGVAFGDAGGDVVAGKDRRRTARRGARRASAKASNATCGLEKLTIWVHAFIPRHIPNALAAFPATRPVPAGVFAGETMLPGPLTINDCFVTDNRTFSDDLDASSRMRSTVILDLKAGEVFWEDHTCDKTHEIDCEDGDIECDGRGVNSGSVSNFQASPDRRSFSFSLRSVANNPCFATSPDIDFSAEFQITLNEQRTQANVLIDGEVDDFPAFEAYAMVEGQAPKQLFQHHPAFGNSPGDLYEWWLLESHNFVSNSVLLEGESCPEAETCCDGTCVDTQSDEAHCGACDEQCGNSLHACLDGQCECPPVSCAEGDQDPETCQCQGPSVKCGKIQCDPCEVCQAPPKKKGKKGKGKRKSKGKKDKQPPKRCMPKQCRGGECNPETGSCEACCPPAKHERCMETMLACREPNDSAYCTCHAECFYQECCVNCPCHDQQCFNECDMADCLKPCLKKWEDELSDCYQQTRCATERCGNCTSIFMNFLPICYPGCVNPNCF